MSAAFSSSMFSDAKRCPRRPSNARSDFWKIFETFYSLVWTIDFDFVSMQVSLKLFGIFVVERRIEGLFRGDGDSRIVGLIFDRNFVEIKKLRT